MVPQSLHSPDLTLQFLRVGTHEEQGVRWPHTNNGRPQTHSGGHLDDLSTACAKQPFESMWKSASI